MNLFMVVCNFIVASKVFAFIVIFKLFNEVFPKVSTDRIEIEYGDTVIFIFDFLSIVLFFIISLYVTKFLFNYFG